MNDVVEESSNQELKSRRQNLPHNHVHTSIQVYIPRMIDKGKIEQARNKSKIITIMIMAMSCSSLSSLSHLLSLRSLSAKAAKKK